MIAGSGATLLHACLLVEWRVALQTESIIRESGLKTIRADRDASKEEESG